MNFDTLELLERCSARGRGWRGKAPLEKHRLSENATSRHSLRGAPARRCCKTGPKTDRVMRPIVGTVDDGPRNPSEVTGKPPDSSVGFMTSLDRSPRCLPAGFPPGLFCRVHLARPRESQCSCHYLYSPPSVVHLARPRESQPLGSRPRSPCSVAARRAVRPDQEREQAERHQGNHDPCRHGHRPIIGIVFTILDVS